jgi:hypothetical protein
MSKKKEKTAVQLHVLKLVPGQFAQANDGNFYEVVSVDPVIDPRRNVFGETTDEAIVCFNKTNTKEREIVRGLVLVQAA